MLVLVPVFGGECFSNHFKCSLVLKHEYFLKLAELAVCLACPHGMKSSSCQSIFQLSCHFLPFHYSLFATRGDIVFPFSLMLRDDF